MLKNSPLLGTDIKQFVFPPNILQFSPQLNQRVPGKEGSAAVTVSFPIPRANSSSWSLWVEISNILQHFFHVSLVEAVHRWKAHLHKTSFLAVLSRVLSYCAHTSCTPRIMSRGPGKDRDTAALLRLSLTEFLPSSMNRPEALLSSLRDLWRLTTILQVGAPTNTCFIRKESGAWRSLGSCSRSGAKM